MKDYEKFEELIKNTKYNGLSEFQTELFSALMLGAKNNEIKMVYNTLADSTIRNHKHILKEKQKASKIQYELFKFLNNSIKNPKDYAIHILKSSDTYKKLKMIPYISFLFPDINLDSYKQKIEEYIRQNGNYYLKALALKAYSFLQNISLEMLEKEFYTVKNDYIKYYILKIFYDKKLIEKKFIDYCLRSNIRILVYAAYFIIKKERILNENMEKIKKRNKELSLCKDLEDIRVLIRKEIKKVKPTFIPINTNLMDKRFEISEEERKKVINSYFSNKKLKIIPAKEKKKIIILQEIIKSFEKGKKYSRLQINNKLSNFYSDYVSLRRYLVEYGFLQRTSDGKEYWLK